MARAIAQADAQRRQQVAGALPSLGELRTVLAGTKFLAGYDFEVEACAAGECDLRVPFKPGLERPGGIVIGVTIMGAADVAMWLAVMTMRGTEEHGVTSDMKTAFLKPGVNESLLCRARVLRLGRRMAYGQVETHGESSGLVAHHVVSYCRAERPGDAGTDRGR